MVEYTKVNLPESILDMHDMLSDEQLEYIFFKKREGGFK